MCKDQQADNVACDGINKSADGIIDHGIKYIFYDLYGIKL